jgi:hypothetical protein
MLYQDASERLRNDPSHQFVESHVHFAPLLASVVIKAVPQLRQTRRR